MFIPVCSEVSGEIDDHYKNCHSLRNALPKGVFTGCLVKVIVGVGIVIY